MSVTAVLGFADHVHLIEGTAPSLLNTGVAEALLVVLSNVTETLEIVLTDLGIVTLMVGEVVLLSSSVTIAVIVAVWAE